MNDESIELKAKVVMSEGEVQALIIFMPDGSLISFPLPALKDSTDPQDVSLKSALEQALARK